MRHRSLLMLSLATFASFASAHTITIVSDSAIQIVPNMVVHGTAGAEKGFYMTTVNGVRHYNAVGGYYYPYQRSNNTSNTYQGYTVTITASDPDTDGTMAYYTDYPVVTWGDVVTGGGGKGGGPIGTDGE